MKKIIITVLLLFVVFCNNANCEEVQKGKVEFVDLSFEQAYQLMLENNNSLKAYNEAIEQMKYEKRAALGEFSPKVLLNSTYIHFSDEMALHTPVSIPMLGSMTTKSLIQDPNLFIFFRLF